jgi:hypothetical protein
MSANINLFKALDTNYESKVKVANGQYVDVKGRGVVDINTLAGLRTFDNVLFVPEIKQNLVSVGQLLEDGHSLSFVNGICTIRDGSGSVLFSAKMNNRSFSLGLENEHMNMSITSSSNSVLWHKRLGHFNYATMKKMTDLEMVIGLPKIQEQKEKKGGVFDTFDTVKVAAEREAGTKMKGLNSDDGSEVSTHKLEGHLEREGIKHQLIVPYSPQHNGVSEKENRTLVEMARCHVYEKKVPLKIWAKTVFFFLNQMVTKGLGEKTPYEIWHGYKPNIEHLRMFGSPYYNLQPKVKREMIGMCSYAVLESRGSVENA